MITRINSKKDIQLDVFLVLKPNSIPPGYGFKQNEKTTKNNPDGWSFCFEKSEQFRCHLNCSLLLGFPSNFEPLILVHTNNS